MNTLTVQMLIQYYMAYTPRSTSEPSLSWKPHISTQYLVWWASINMLVHLQLTNLVPNYKFIDLS